MNNYILYILLILLKKYIYLFKMSKDVKIQNYEKVKNYYIILILYNIARCYNESNTFFA